MMLCLVSGIVDKCSSFRDEVKCHLSKVLTLGVTALQIVDQLLSLGKKKNNSCCSTVHLQSL